MMSTETNEEIRRAVACIRRAIERETEGMPGEDRAACLRALVSSIEAEAPVDGEALESAVEDLAHDRGRKAAIYLLAMLENGGIALDTESQAAFLTLLRGAWGGKGGTVRELLGLVAGKD